MKQFGTIFGILLFLVCVSSTSGQQSVADTRYALKLLDELPPDVQTLPNCILVKFARHSEHLLHQNFVGISSLTPLLTHYGVTTMTQMYPRHESHFTASGAEIALQRMYRLDFSGDEDPIDVARAFCMHPDIEYAEPEIVHSILYTPDDPRLSQQYALSLVKAMDAWDITTGSEDIVIAIVDSGVRWTHEDLYANIWINPAEDINGDGIFQPWPVTDTINGISGDLDGIDNDGNGYIDDVIGIDFVGPSPVGGGTYYDHDPDPTPRGNPHGTHVAGIAAARGDNGKGIAGLAYTCRIMSIKCAPDVNIPSIIRGYDGIVYAADNGAHVINCSWGGGGYMQSQAERIQYANSKGAIVIAAAGNSGNERVHTPAAYPNVLSVANTGPEDKIHTSSTYGPWVDVSAPGANILSCVISSDSAYASFTGTSMASPLVAGLAGLIRSRFPEFSPEQVFEQIRVTADNIDDLQATRYRRKIGRGRINAYRALTEQSPGVRLVDWNWDDAPFGNADGFADRGERIAITMRWKNVLAPTQNAVIRLSSPNPLVTIEQGEFFVGRIETLSEISNEAQPFIIVLADEYAPNDQVDLTYEIEDGSYTDHGGVFFIQQPTYRDHDINDILVTLTNDGNIGFDDMTGIRGSGFRYKGAENVLFEGALMVGGIVNYTPLVVDVARSGSTQQLRDFESESLYDIWKPGKVAEQQGSGLFMDLGARLADRLQTEISLASFAFTREEARNMVFLRYRVENISANLQEQVHAGLFFDWDIGVNSRTDIAIFNDSLRLALCFDTTGNPRVETRVGVLPLAQEFPVTYWGINNGDSDDSLRIGIYNGFTKAEKWKALTTGVIQPVTNITDVSYVIGNALGDMQPGDTVVLGFALIAGHSIEEITDAVPIARAIWDTLVSHSDPTPVETMAAPPMLPKILSLSPHPLLSGDAELRVESLLPSAGAVTLRVHDLLGRLRYTSQSIEASAGRMQHAFRLPSLSPGSYVLTVTQRAHTAAIPFLVVQ